MKTRILLVGLLALIPFAVSIAATGAPASNDLTSAIENSSSSNITELQDAFISYRAGPTATADLSNTTTGDVHAPVVIDNVPILVAGPNTAKVGTSTELPNLRMPLSPGPAVPTAVDSGDDRELTTPTAWYVYWGQTEAGLINIINSTNSRIIDIQVETTTVPHKFTAAFVANTGVYAKAWWWYYDQTPAQATFILTSTNSRFISLKAYELSPGDLRFAFTSVSNTGADNKAWWWYYNATPADISNVLSLNNARLVQLHQYKINGLTRYAVVMISNTGADAKAWWYYYNQTPSQIAALVSTNNARVIDLDRDEDTGNYNVIMEYWPTQPPNWQHIYGVNGTQLLDYAAQFGSRVIDFTSYDGCGSKCYTAAFLDNSDAVTSRVGHMLRVGIGGQANGETVAVGLYLKQVGGPTLAELEPDFAYQPASSIKVVEHLYTMRRVQSGLNSLTDQIVHYTNGASSCPNPPLVSGTEPLTTALRNMMRYSDNARTREISDTFGVVNFDNLMHNVIGMSANSHMGEIIGCGGSNQFTLRDAGLLYEGVANGSLLSGQNRENFYYLMAGKEQYLEEGYDFTGVWSPALDTIISQEKPPGMTDAMTKAYKSKMRLNYKAGGYTFCQNGPCNDVREYISITGLAQIPFCSSGTMTVRQYAFGTFLHGVEDTSWFNGKNTLADQTFNSTKAEVLREQIRAGLASCFFQNFLPLVMR